jgi:hypothetical protein
MRQIIACLALLLIGAHSLHADDASERAVRLGVMTWYHPVLEPGVAAITLLCSVVRITEGRKYESPYWNVRLRIDERIHVADRFAKRLQDVRFIESRDFRKRAVGDRLVLFAGLGEPYEGDDFLLPCWSGTTSDLGIVLHPQEHEEHAANERLLASLREQARNFKETADSLEAFAAFCPSGVAHHLIMKIRMQEPQSEKAAKPPKTKP